VQLLLRARRGDREALDELFARHLPGLRRWARGRLPRWARDLYDTGDLVQDAVMRTFRRLESFEPRRQKALQAYLRRAVLNQLRDEVRRLGRNPAPDALTLDFADAGPSPHEQASQGETEERYRRALQKLSPDDRELVVGRLELEYSFEQLALATGRPTPDAARMGLRRALLKLAQEMGDG
jgi:RNA polymerase sigma-70 factor (ECF subfamily)